MIMLLSIITGLYNKLVHLTNNSLINITNDITLSSIIRLVGHSNITILGHNSPTVYCNIYGGLHLMSCYNCTIEGIRWEGCGGRKNGENKHIHPVLQLSNSSSITFKNCSFQNSKGQALVLSGVSQDVNVEYCQFLHNTQYGGHGTAIYYSSNTLYHYVHNLTISNCKFDQNSGTISVVHFGSLFKNLISQIHIHNSSFSFNKGVSIYLSNQNLDIHGSNEFYGNSAKNGAGIYISDYSKVIFHKSAMVNFTNNTATNNGGAIYLNNHGSIFFDEYPMVYYVSDPGTLKSVITFKHNQADYYGKDIYAYHSNITVSGDASVVFIGYGKHTYSANSALHIENHCNILFDGSSDITFKNQAMSIYDQSEVIFKDVSVKFYDNTGDGTMNIYSSKVTFKGNCRVVFNNNTNYGGVMFIYYSTVKLKEESIVKFNNNEAESDGGAMYITYYSTVTFEGNSQVSFIKNKASQLKDKHYGGAMYIANNSNVTFEGNSKVNFNKNRARYGGAISIKNCPSVNVILGGNSTVTFDDNEARDGGAMYTHYCNLIVGGNSKVTFNNNKAYYNGGAIYIGAYSYVTFEGNSTVKFNNNSAYTDGGAAYIGYAATTFTGSSKVFFHNNSANSGGAVYSFLGCVDITQIMTFSGNSLTAFDSNKCSDKGGAVCVDGTDPTYTENCFPLKFGSFSTVTFNNNEGVNGGAVYLGYNINMKSQQNSAITFNSNKAHVGGAIYSFVSNITFQGNSNVMFNCNVALQDGGALFSYSYCNISFTENATAKCIHNEAAHGAVLNLHFASIIKFRGNSKIKFTENKAIEYGGVIYTSVNSLILFDDDANVLFLSNAAKSGGALNLYDASITNRLKSNVIFNNNTAEEGAAIYTVISNITFTGNSSIQFINNTALQDGGAIYLSDHTNFVLIDKTKVNFSDNFASDDGKAIYVQIKDSLINFNTTKIHFNNNIFKATKRLVYINVPKSCNKSCLSQRVKNIQSLPIATSPKKLILYNPVKCIDNSKSDCTSYYINNIMLGQEIRFNACVLDYYNRPTELTQFVLTGMNHQHYNMSGSKYISVSCNYTTQGISVIGNLNTLFNYSIKVSSYVAKTSGSKVISVNLTVGLSECHPGFYYSSESQKCGCYSTKNIISCSGSSSTIKRGYWFGSVNGQSTVASCPNDYCDFTCCKITNGIYHLFPVRANQCRVHRSGRACGNCDKDYTLSFDSPQCIEINKCTDGQTVLVIAMSSLYWIAVIVAVFGMMYFKVPIGSLYAILYYYSVVDILLRDASFISNGLYMTINILSSLAKLTPQFLGQLCLVRNMSGIDQQFIHFVHPIVVSLILVMICVLARRSHRISSFISRGIIHFICFLLLLSYTSVTTTSLLLMRSLKFEGINEIYTYLSPDVEYFHGRHLAYVITAIIFTITIVSGLPLLLLLEPFLNSKINFVKIKPLLDQFQGVYKDNYRSFAAFYMICRIVIIVLVIIRGSDDLITQYVLMSICVLMALIHLIVRPYVDKVHNIFDGIILQLIIIISVLPIIEFTGSYDETLVAVVIYAFVILPLTSFLAIKLWFNKNRIQNNIKSAIIKCKHKYNAIPTDDNDVEIEPINEVTVDNSVRRNVTVIDV